MSHPPNSPRPVQESPALAAPGSPPRRLALPILSAIVNKHLIGSVRKEMAHSGPQKLAANRHPPTPTPSLPPPAPPPCAPQNPPHSPPRLRQPLCEPHTANDVPTPGVPGRPNARSE